MASGMISLRELTADDWADWRLARLAALADAPDAFGSTLTEWSGPADREDRWRARLESVPFNLLAERDGRTVGMVSGDWPQRGSVELLSMWVAPVARGLGVGDALIQAVVDWARDGGARMVNLAVREANGPAIALYVRNGFRDAGSCGIDPREPAERAMVRPVSAEHPGGPAPRL